MELKKKKNNYIKRFRKWVNNIIHPEENPSFNAVEVTVVIIIAILFGIIVGCILTYGKGLAKSTENQYIKEFISTYETIVENYYDDVSEEELINAAVDGMIDSLGDEHSYYMDSTETFDFNQRLDGSYVGVGATISYNVNGNTIADVFEDSPAEKAGLSVGDVILKVDDIDVVGYTLDKLSPLLIGEEGTKVKIMVQRNGEYKIVTLIRGRVVVPSVFSKLVEINNKSIGYIDIDTFAANSYSQFNKHLKSLEKEKIDGLIIDVRDNTGGHLAQVNKILSLFFNKKTVLYQIETKEHIEKIYSSSKGERKYEVVVLINGGSASASEILASSFQENYKKATVVGLRSYGKGTIQTAMQLSTGASLKYTTQKWLTSSGVWLDGVGVIPDVEIQQEGDFYDVAEENDSQYMKALNILGE